LNLVIVSPINFLCFSVKNRYRSCLSVIRYFHGHFNHYVCYVIVYYIKWINNHLSYRWQLPTIFNRSIISQRSAWKGYSLASPLWRYTAHKPITSPFKSLKISYSQLRIGQPFRFNDPTALTQEIYPQECRLASKTYSAPLFAEITR
jgi:hypothetical protein